MSTVLYNVATMPEWQARLRAEVSNVLRGKSDLAYGDLSDLKELDYFVIESARLRPAVEVTFPEKLAQDQVIGGYLIPAGTSVCASVSALNRDPALFPNPGEFSPLRHADEITRKSIHRFGLGVRRCMGFRFANTMIKCLLVAAVRRFSITMPQQSHCLSRTIIPMLPADALAASLHFELR